MPLADELSRAALLVTRALVAQSEADDCTLRLADLGVIGPTTAELSRRPRIAELVERRALAEARADRAWQEVTRLGGQITDRALGAVDWPLERGGRDLLLCWQLGEAEPAFWHERGEPCSQRRPLSELADPRG